MKVIQLNKYIECENISVTDNEVENIIELREGREQLKKQLSDIEARLELAEDTIIQRLEFGVKVRSRYPLEIKTRERYFPSWKEAFLNRLGNAEAAKVLAQTTPKIYKTLIIEK